MTRELRDCPVCGSGNIQPGIERRGLPQFQNVVYPSADEARAAPQCDLVLATCRDCGFTYNAVFEELVYDERYDNEVCSGRFGAYYDEIIDILIARFDLTGGYVYDIGCGNGEFLERLCERAPGIIGVGIDPSCTPVQRGRFTLLKDIFRPTHFHQDTRLVLCRHVLEHIARPLEFLSALRAASPAAPLYVEVPDLDWIFRTNAFWDFCYEHCNYFNPRTLRMALVASGFAVSEQAASFADQYQWAIAAPSSPAGVVGCTGEHDLSAQYGIRERALLKAMAAKADRGDGLVLWGMATKGVMLSVLLGPDRVRAGIDRNIRKQGQFAPLSGVAIRAPEWLATVPAEFTVLATNPIYLDEIREEARRAGATQAIESV